MSDGDSTVSATALPVASIVATPPGVADREHDPAVVALVVNGNVACSGALVAPDVVLTEMSCVTEGDAPGACSSDGGGAGRTRNPASLEVLVGEGTTGGGLRGRGRDVIVPQAASACEGDVALVMLNEPVYGTRPLKVRTTGAATGNHVRTSGFAAEDAGAAKIVRDHVYVEGTNTRELRLEEACWTLGGSPALDEVTGAIVGVEGGPSEAHAQDRKRSTRTPGRTRGSTSSPVRWSWR